MHKHLLGTVLCLAALLFSCKKSAPDLLTEEEAVNRSAVRTAKPTEEQTVRFIYLIPSDREYNKEYERAITKAARILQRWYQDQLGGWTFRLNNPVVEVLHSDEPAAWFGADNSTSGTDPFFYFFFNTYNEIRDILGSQWDLSRNVFTVYVDAYGQTGAGATGMAFLPENDLLGLTGRMEAPVIRWIGGLGHELGHAFGLSHPDGSPEWNVALMGLGYTIFPDSILLPSDQATLLNSGFFFQK